MPKGIVSVTDAKIRYEFETEKKFIRQICREYKVGVHRVRRIVKGLPQ